MGRGWRIVSLVAMLVHLWTGALAAGQDPARASGLRGTVSDPSGGVLARAAVDLVSETGLTRSTVSDEAGRYEFVAVPGGGYRIFVLSTGRKVAKAHAGRLASTWRAVRNRPLRQGTCRLQRATRAHAAQ